MTNTTPFLSPYDELTSSEIAECARATDFVLEASYERYDDTTYLPIEDGEDSGSYSIALGLADRSPMRMWWSCAGFDELMAMAQRLRDAHPQAGLWLRCEGVQTEIEGADVLCGLINARAEAVEPDDTEDEWLMLADDIKAGSLALASTSYSPFFIRLVERFAA